MKKNNLSILLLAWLIGLGIPVHRCAADVSSLVGHWKFESDSEPDLTPFGDVKFEQAGPRSPEFPDFATLNKAVKLNGKGAGLLVVNGGNNSDFQFTNGDAITLEAWVRVDRITPGQAVYLIGKGRSVKPEYVYGNQNWSLRLTQLGEAIRLDFLFTTKNGEEKSQWHRWRSRSGFLPATGWHHVALTYQFGTPESARGWIDGSPTTGNWDLAGPTRRQPVVDADDVWIGTSMNRGHGVSFRGLLDEVIIHRARLDDEILAERFRRTGGARVATPLPEEMPQLGALPRGKVHYALAEKVPSHTRWLYEDEEWPAATDTWEGNAFLLARIPSRFDRWGTRIQWEGPLLLRIAADVDLPAGKQKFLMRGRGLGRLWIDGTLVIKTQADTVRYVNGRNPIVPQATPPAPGLRPRGGNMQEVFGEVEIKSENGSARATCRVVVELIVGGPRVRPEPGEVCIALMTENGSSYEILKPVTDSASPEAPLKLTDAVVETALDDLEAAMLDHDDAVRRRAASSQDSFWNMRHELARNWAKSQQVPAVPVIPGQPEIHPIDAFLQARIAHVQRASAHVNPAEAEHFYGKVFPILQENCFRCHGDKEQGGLKLNDRESALKGGDSETPAIVPGKSTASELLARVKADDDSGRMPPTGKGLTATQIDLLEEWIENGAAWPARPAPPQAVAKALEIDDAAFLRRIYLDMVGVLPTAAEASDFLSDRSPDKRTQLIHQLLKDDRIADQWISYWLDVLAENPSLISATLNSTGPFRWFLYDALRDNLPIDRMVTELIMMRGSVHEGGSAGFAIAGENDSPFAAKGHILATAFLGIELQCARCHDSPFHSTTQKDLYSLAAMLNRKPLSVPASSQVPAAFFDSHKSESIIKVTLKPGEEIPPVWPFAELTGVADTEQVDRLLQSPGDSRERLAALITSPRNQRFALVVTNRIWKQLIGAGFIEPVYDWEGHPSSHPELHAWLAHELVTHQYDVRYLIRLITTSTVYQSQAIGQNLTAIPELRLFNAPDRRRLSAEQVVDCLHAATGHRMNCEQLSFDPEGRDTQGRRLSLGTPTRAWMMADLKNERDRPSLALPRARVIADVLEAFGWTGSRQMPVSQREIDPNVLQPGVLANGVLSLNLMRASLDSSLADLAVDAQTAEELLDTLFLQILTRPPQPEEKVEFLATLTPGFDERVLPQARIHAPQPLDPLPQITWYNHANAKANVIQKKKESRLRKGPPSDPRLQPDWRERFEDVVWSLINHRDFVWIP